MSCAVQLSREGRQLGELFLHQRIIDVEHRSALGLATSVIPGEVNGDGVEVGAGIADCPYVRYARHAHIDLLSELCRNRLPADAPI